MGLAKEDKISAAVQSIHYCIKIHDRIYTLTHAKDFTCETKSFYTNFRDSTLHFVEMIGNQDKDIEAFDYNFYAVFEHLNRGLVDFLVFIFQQSADRVDKKLKEIDCEGQKTNRELESIKILRKTLHKLRNSVLLLRMDGVNSSRIISYNMCNPILKDYITTISEFLKVSEQYKLILASPI